MERQLGNTALHAVSLRFRCRNAQSFRVRITSRQNEDSLGKQAPRTGIDLPVESRTEGSRDTFAFPQKDAFQIRKPAKMTGAFIRNLSLVEVQAKPYSESTLPFGPS